MKKHAPRAAEVLTGAVCRALDQQSVVVVGAGAAGTVLPKLAEQLLALRRQLDEIADQVEALVEAQPLYEVLTSMPGIEVRTCARLLSEVTGKHFASAAHLASYAGVAPATRRSGTSIRGEHPSRRGNKKLKRALFLSAFAALHHPLRGRTTTANAQKLTQLGDYCLCPAPLGRTFRDAPRRNLL